MCVCGCVDAQRNTEVAGQCGAQVEDYIECLHHKKEVRLAFPLASAWAKRVMLLGLAVR